MIVCLDARIETSKNKVQVVRCCAWDWFSSSLIFSTQTVSNRSSICAELTKSLFFHHFFLYRYRHVSLINTCQCIILLCTNGLSIEPTTLGLKDVVRPLAIMQSQPVASMYTISAFRIKYTARENHSTTLLERTIFWLKRTSYDNITTSLQKNGENGGFEFKAICFSVHRLSLFEYIEKRTWALPSFLTDPVRTPKFNMAHDLQKIGLSFLDFQVDEFNVPL